jgi:hypothetical protein
MNKYFIAKPIMQKIFLIKMKIYEIIVAKLKMV